MINFWQVHWWTLSPGGNWQDQGAILEARYNGYAHFQESLAWGADHRTLFLCCRIHERTDAGKYGRIQTVGFMKSKDFGRTWRKSDESMIPLPASATDLEVLAAGGLDQGRILRAGSMTVDRNNKPHLVYSVQEKGSGTAFLTTLDHQPGTWRKVRLNDFLPDHLQGQHVIMSGGLAFNQNNEPIIIAQVQAPVPASDSWGHPSTEVVMFHSRDEGHTFQCSEISIPNPWGDQLVA